MSMSYIYGGQIEGFKAAITFYNVYKPRKVIADI